jgi:hypothetical protein
MQLRVSPIEKILQLLGDLQAKIINEGEEVERLFEEFTDYCKDTSKDTQFEIQTAEASAERFSASVDDASAQITELESKIDSLSSSVSTNSKDLASATEIRKAEKADYDKADAELAETVDMLRRAIGIIEKSMKGGSFLQVGPSMQEVSDALSALVGAEGVRGVSVQDQQRLQAFLQQQEGDEDLQPAGAPAPAAYKSQSGGILAAMEDMLEKAEAQRADGQKSEMEANHNFEMLKQSLQDSVAAEEKELADAKKAKAVAEEEKAEAQGELERTNKELADDQKKLKDLQHECMTKAEEHELAQKERGEELNALATAKKILEEKTGGAAERTYSFVQLEQHSSQRQRQRVAVRSRQLKDRIVSLLQSLAQKTDVQALAQLASRVRSEMLVGADPFAKVKGMLQEMIEKLLAEAKQEAGKKAFCDKEMAETTAKREDKQDEVDDLNTKIDKAAAKIAKLKESISSLEAELAKIAEEQKKATEMRTEEKAAWDAAKADFEQGLEGVQMALQVLRDYYAEKDGAALLQGGGSDIGAAMSLAQKSSGAASGIIGMLEVAESDFSKMLAEGNAAEDQAQKEYETVFNDNKVTAAAKETEVKYAKKDKKETEAFLEETKEDLGTSNTELSAILEYWEKLKPQCIAKPEPYEERKKRREKEIAGLKEALDILETEAGF